MSGDPEMLLRIRDGVVYLIGLILSICVHEFGHAIVADKLGDPLPRAEGRVTLNPIAHIDPIGTIVLPLIMFFNPGATLLGWGKPVQVSLSPRHMTRRFSIKVSHAFIAAAGPMMNVLFAMVLTGVWIALVQLGGHNTHQFRGYVAYLIEMNFILAFFNLIPCPPLDGGAILHGILPHSLEWISESLQKYGFIILFALLFTGALGRLMWPATWAFDNWMGLVHGLVRR
jgi:Zn-dependent protease